MTRPCWPTPGASSKATAPVPRGHIERDRRGGQRRKLDHRRQGLISGALVGGCTRGKVLLDILRGRLCWLSHAASPSLPPHCYENAPSFPRNQPPYGPPRCGGGTGIAAFAGMTK